MELAGLMTYLESLDCRPSSQVPDVGDKAYSPQSACDMCLAGKGGAGRNLAEVV